MTQQEVNRANDEDGGSVSRDEETEYSEVLAMLDQLLVCTEEMEARLNQLIGEAHKATQVEELKRSALNDGLPSEASSTHRSRAPLDRSPGYTSEVVPFVKAG